jgi:hypothetical protein
MVVKRITPPDALPWIAAAGPRITCTEPREADRRG